MNKLPIGSLVAGFSLAIAACTAPGSSFVEPTGTGGFSGTGGFGFDQTGSGGQQLCGASPSFSGSGGELLLFGSAAPRPQFGATVTPAVAPPAISGGTLRLLRNGRFVVASDPDRDRIYIVELATAKVVATVPLTRGDEPGRVVEDGSGRVHVALRGGGAIVSLDPSTWTIGSRRAVCTAPRGLAYEATGDRIHVACTDGQLISLPAAGGAATRTLRLDPDLRDIVVDGDSLLVSRFRSAQVLTINANGAVDRTLTPAPFRSFEAHSGQQFSASVAWRMVEMPGGGAAMVHQRGMSDQIGAQPGGYAGFNPCDAIVHTTVTVVKKDSVPPPSPVIPGMVLATDLAVSADGKRIALIASGNANNAPEPGMPSSMPRVFVTDMDNMMDGSIGCRSDGIHGPCMSGGRIGTGGSSGGFFAGSVGGAGNIGGDPATGAGGAGGAVGSTDAGTGMPIIAPPVDVCGSTSTTGTIPDVVGEPIAVVFDATGSVVVQTREPAALFLASGAKVVLSTDSRADTGHAVFHSNAGGNVACASCHPEGTDDGRVWSFSCEGDRRTQSLNIGLAGTAPFHWNGDMTSFGQLMTNVFVGRMSGPNLASEQQDATFTWIDHQPRVRPLSTSNDPAVTRGRALFNDGATAACASCHAGAKFTNNLSVDVGTGGIFQVPSLIGVGSRAPFMHNGCAKTLQDRFSVGCGGGDKHGVISRLNSTQISDLISFLETL